MIQILESPLIDRQTRHETVKAVEQLFESPQFESEFAGTSKKTKTDAYSLLSTNYLQLAIDSHSSMKEGLFQRMRSWFNRTDRIDIHERRSFILKGYYCVFMQDYKQATEYFESGKEADELNLSYLIGSGLVEFQKRNFVDCLAHWKTAFRHFRKQCPETAYLLGQVYLRMGKGELAEKCFSYCLKRSPELKVKCLVSLSIASLQDKEYDRFYELLIESFLEDKSGPSDINLTLQLAEHYFYKGESERAKRLIEVSLSILSFWSADKLGKSKDVRSDFSELKSRLLYLQAFAEHQRLTSEGMAEAYKFYCAATQLNPHNYAAQFGLAQVYLHQKNHSEALTCLEFIIKNTSDTDCQEVYRLLPLLYVKTNQREKAQTAFQKALQFHPESIDLMVDYANFIDSTNPKTAIAVYDKLDKLLKVDSSSLFVQPELYNNWGVALAKEGESEKAAAVFEKAIELAERDAQSHKQGSEEFVRHQSTVFGIRFNQAQLLHSKGQTLKAIELVNELVSRHKAVYEGHLALALMQQSLGNYDKARQAIERSIAVCSRLPKLARTEECLCAKTNLLIAQKDYHQAMSFVQKFRGSDPYYLVLKAKLLYNYIVYSRANSNEVRKMIKEGAATCHSIITLPEEESNVLAALISAAMLLERGRLADAMKVFNQFQNIIRDNPLILHNQSIVDLYTTNVDRIVLRFESIKEPTKSVYKAIYALAYTIREEWAKAERIWKYRLLKEPSLKNWFNFAAFLDERLKSLAKPKHKSISEMERSLEGGSLARRVFIKVDQLVPDKVLLCLNPELNSGEIERRKLAELRQKAERHVFFIDQNFQNYKQQLEKERVRKQEEKLSQENRKYMIDKEKEDALLLEEEKRKEQLRLEEEAERKAQEAEAKAREFAEKFAKLSVTETKKGTRRGGRPQRTEGREGQKFKGEKRTKKGGERQKRRRRKDREESEESLLDDQKSESKEFIDNEDESDSFVEKSIDSDEESELERRSELREEKPKRKEQEPLKRVKETETEVVETQKKKRVFLDDEEDY